MTSNQEQLAGFIRNEWKKKAAANPRFSMRSLARYLGIGPSTCSEILSGKRTVSRTVASQILDRLEAPVPVRTNILAGFKGEKRATQIGPRLKLRDFNEADLWSDWKYFAILSLLETPDITPTSAFIARKLSLKKSDADGYLGILTMTGLVEKKGSHFHLTGNFYLKSSDEVISSAVKKNHSECLKMAQKALKKVPMEKRDYTNVMACFDENQLPEIKKAVRDFHNKLLRISQKGNREKVYRFATQLFPVSKELQGEHP